MLVENEPVKINGFSAGMHKNPIPIRVSGSVSAAKAVFLQHLLKQLQVAPPDCKVQVRMRAGLSPQQGINAPSSIYPVREIGIFKAAAEADYRFKFHRWQLYRIIF